MSEAEKTTATAAAKAAQAKTCPNCGKPQLEAYKPFCSKRCADVDLARWLKGSYAIAGKAETDDGRVTIAGPERLEHERPWQHESHPSEWQPETRVGGRGVALVEIVDAHAE